MTVHHHEVKPGAAIRTQLVTVTPFLAHSWLAKNKHNRNLRKALVSMYARDMAAGKWIMTGETIKFGPQGLLLDGQHRLAAVVQANVPVEMLVAWGISAEAQHVMDTGAKRTTGDALGLKGFQHAATLAAAARLEFGIRQLVPGDVTVPRAAATQTEIMELVEKEPMLLRATEMATHYAPIITDLRPSVVAVAYFNMMKVDQEATVQFWESIAYNHTEGQGDPRNALIRRLATARRNHEGLNQIAELTLVYRAWNAWRKGKRVNALPVASRMGKVELPQRLY